MNHTDDSIRQLFNKLVDTELGPVRPVPAFDDSRSGTLRQWRVPLLAASVIALLATGSVLAVDASRNQRSGPAAGGTIPVTLTTSKPSKMIRPADIFADVPEAADVPGVQVRPVSAAENAKEGVGLIQVLTALPSTLKPGRSYSITVELMQTTAAHATSIVTLTARAVASAQCPPAFLGHADHTYLISCTFVPKAGEVGAMALRTTTPSGYEEGTFYLSKR
jgi:hypothetical protein